MFEKVLVANRGEIASRVINTLQRLNIEAVAVYDDRERNTPYVQLANASFSLGTGLLSDTFLNGKRIIEIARQSGSTAIHPGYGFLSENPAFAAECVAEGIVFIGPSPETISAMGNKIKAAKIAQNIGIPVIPQIRGTISAIVHNVGKNFLPCLVKASAGGGGKGMYRANNANELENLLKRTSAEAEKFFGNGEVYIEKYLDNPRHIEVQILADNHGNTVHLFERECSVQRRFQKIIEEAPATSIPTDIKDKLYKDAINLSKKVAYLGAGTVEFLIDQNGNHFFLEMNTRIQVEHGITELITGVDIVEEQLAIAAGESISQKARQATIRGHAIEARIYAEDPANDFRPSTGITRLVYFPLAENLRIDADIQSNSEVYADFDPMLAKIMVNGEDREAAISLLKSGVKSTILQGVKNNLATTLNILNEADFLNNSLSTHYLKKHPDVMHSENRASDFERNLLISAGLYLSMNHYPYESYQKVNLPIPGFWRILHKVSVSLDAVTYGLTIRSMLSKKLSFTLDNEIIDVRILRQSNAYIDLNYAGQRERVCFSWDKKNMSLSLSIDYRDFVFKRKDFLTKKDFSYQQNKDLVEDSALVRAPLNGKVIKVNRVAKQLIQKGEVLLVIESMKMENEIKIPSAVLIKEICVSEGQLVQEGDVLAYLEPKKSH